MNLMITYVQEREQKLCDSFSINKQFLQKGKRVKNKIRKSNRNKYKMLHGAI